MVAENDVGEFLRQVPILRDDFSTLTMRDSKDPLLGFVQGNPVPAGFFETTAEIMGRNPKQGYDADKIKTLAARGVIRPRGED